MRIPFLRDNENISYFRKNNCNIKKSTNHHFFALDIINLSFLNFMCTLSKYSIIAKQIADYKSSIKRNVTYTVRCSIDNAFSGSSINIEI